MIGVFVAGLGLGAAGSWIGLARTETTTVVERQVVQSVVTKTVEEPAPTPADTASSSGPPTLGIEFIETTPAMIEKFSLSRCSGQANKAGLLVTAVEGGGPADQAGVRGSTFSQYNLPMGGDIITAVDDTTVRTGGDLQNALAIHDPEDAVELRLISCRGKERTAVVLTSP